MSSITDPFGDMQDYVPFLESIARDKRVLEIGTRFGVSTGAFLRGGARLYSVDIDPRSGNHFRDPRWTFICADSRDDWKVKAAVVYPVDILLIDGDHSYEMVSCDLRCYSPWVKNDGLILMHDVELSQEALDKVNAAGETWAGEPRRAMDEFLESHPSWKAEIYPGKWGMGVLRRG